ncbi:hypothetical protein MTR67_026554 [Solanum verrucosum]|uniref:Uncharacterized protein n=1 Tax=Solanum verrucosum TaxID=315347 RepID=A0AAF0R7Y4_SOLVR|nr:hypothetical protein MTR67_026554 [Solanum verrucosum]
MLMNKMQSQWVEMFPCIIGKVNTFDVISTGIGETKSGTLLLVLGLLWMSLSTQSKRVRNNIKLRNVEGSLLVELLTMCLMVILRACVGFGAQRWMSSLQRLSEFLRVMTSFVDSIGNREYFLIAPSP